MQLPSVPVLWLLRRHEHVEDTALHIFIHVIDSQRSSTLFDDNYVDRNFRSIMIQRGD